MIKKQELLRRLEIAENEIDDLRRDRNIDNDNINLNIERTDYVTRFLADKLGYEIKLKDVIKVNYKGEKSIATEVEMVPLNMFRNAGVMEIPKPKRKYNKRKKK